MAEPLDLNIKYYKQMMIKHRLWIIFPSLFLGLIFLATSLLNTYTSSTIYNFHTQELLSSNSKQFEHPVAATTESIRDKSFNYVQSFPFYFELAKALDQDPEGKKLFKIFKRSKKNFLMKVKGLFVETISFDKGVDTNIQLAQSLQRIISFKKNSDNGLILYVKTGKPESSVSFGKLMTPMIKTILLKNEFHDLDISAGHLREQLELSQAELNKINADLIQHNSLIQNESGVRSAPVAFLEIEKELRMAKIEVQRFNLLINKLDQEIKANSTYSIEEKDYKYVDQLSLERLTELKQQRDISIAKAQSTERSYEKMKQENSLAPISEQVKSSLLWNLELEYSINKDLKIRYRDLEATQKLVNNSLRVVGETSLPVTSRISKMMRFFIGLFAGVLAGLIGLFYYFDIFKVVRGNEDLKSYGNHEILHAIPRLPKTNAGLDVYKTLPENHYAIEAIRLMMDKIIEAKVVSFLSADKGDGKSFLVANLAHNLARYGQRVLVVDTNWKNPTLSVALSGSENIKVVTAQQFSHAKDAFLDQQLLIRQIKLSSKECDIVLIDTQSLNESHDGLIAARVTNQTIIVASQLQTYHYKLTNLIKKLEAAEISDYSFILNKADLKNEVFKARIPGLDKTEAQTLYMRKSS